MLLIFVDVYGTMPGVTSSEETRRWETVSPSSQSQQSPAEEHNSQVCGRRQIFIINMQHLEHFHVGSCDEL